MTGTEGQPGVGELSRQVQAVLTRFESLATRLETSFVSKEFYTVNLQLIDETVRGVRESLATLRTTVDRHDATHATVERIKNLEKEFEELKDDYKDDKKWIVRLVIGALVLAAIAFALGGGYAAGGTQ